MPSYYPEEIWLEIFRKLPVKSLGRCITRNNDLFLVTACFPGEGSQAEYSLHVDDQEFSNFTLCNPIIKKFIRLPDPHLRSIPFEFSIGFGFDSRRNDYKVLKVSKDNVSDKYLQAELFSLKKNSWKKLAPLKYALYSSDCMAFANGVVYWIASEKVFGRVWKLLLLGFDMGDEVLKEIELPEHLSNPPERSELFVLPYGELSSIAVIQLESLRGECNIWVMKTYGVVGTWTKILSVNFGRTDTGLMPRVLGFRKNGGLILHNFTDEQVSQQPEGNEIKNFEIRGIYAFVFSFVESLSLLDPVIDAVLRAVGSEKRQLRTGKYIYWYYATMLYFEHYVCYTCEHSISTIRALWLAHYNLLDFGQEQKTHYGRAFVTPNEAFNPDWDDAMVFVNGVVHFVGYDESVNNRGRHKLLAVGFHMTNEVKEHDESSSIAVIQVDHEPVFGHRTHHVWVMKEL
ncbi:hypothetical protein COLO4_09455 [Corchorus olitorius]|uniref:F-box associated beta-propeller type 3 domain-containing protein n=1 Tax=Corchorus olitorius TaxID=93759 RepID=A0A1R3KC66_9ROSI|nr:hypothetical protein COLO4_09455 [Corchorus olitorius]